MLIVLEMREDGTVGIRAGNILVVDGVNYTIFRSSQLTGSLEHQLVTVVTSNLILSVH